MDENEISVADISSQYKEGVDLTLAEKPIGEILVEKGLVTQSDVEEALKEHKTTGQALVEKGKVSRDAVEKMALAQSQSRKIAKSSTIRVETDKLDKLVNLVGEMVISVARMSQCASDISDTALARSLQGAISALERISRDLQEQVMRVRMVPVEGTFNRFRRVVRDLSFELGKKIEIKMSGTDTELDKNVIEQISDPLKHMIRNSIDHGIEMPEERRQIGKAEIGVIWLKAFQREGNIFIEISDDGKGIDKKKVLAKAIEKGQADAGKSYSDREIFDMLFAPGLSTSENVSELSGRGVGMDVVKRNIEDLRGSIEIISEEGKGSTFRIKLPLTLAIIDGMMVKVGTEVLTIPLSVIDKSVRPSRAEIKTVEGKGELVDIKGDYLPLVRLYQLFNLPSVKIDPTEALVVVLHGEQNRFGILVDDVLGQMQAVIKSIDKNFKKIEGTSGATILGNGKVSLILDVYSIERMAFRL
jgi:two-component system chemotaxis sensor kinase CheA